MDNNLLGELSSQGKLHTIELLWNYLEESTKRIPPPDWISHEAIPRRAELRSNPEIGLSHEEV